MKDQLDTLEFPLTLKRQHLFITNEAGRWVYDTGSPTSFGKVTAAPLSGRRIDPHLDIPLNLLCAFFGLLDYLAGGCRTENLRVLTRTLAVW